MKKQKEFYSLVEKLSSKYSPNAQLNAGKSYISIESTQVFKLRESIQQNSDFLKNINMFTVFDSIGDKLSCVSKNITGRQENSRNVAQVEHDNQRYELIETDRPYQHKAPSSLEKQINSKGKRFYIIHPYLIEDEEQHTT